MLLGAINDILQKAKLQFISKLPIWFYFPRITAIIVYVKHSIPKTHNTKLASLPSIVSGSIPKNTVFLKYVKPVKMFVMSAQFSNHLYEILVHRIMTSHKHNLRITLPNTVNVDKLLRMISFNVPNRQNVILSIFSKSSKFRIFYNNQVHGITGLLSNYVYFDWWTRRLSLFNTIILCLPKH